MHGRWVIADISDMTKSSDFLYILSKTDELSAELNRFGERGGWWFLGVARRGAASCPCRSIHSRH